MKSKIILGISALFLCLSSGVIGAYTMMRLQARGNDGKTLQVHRLELIDAKKNVRAVFAAEDDGNVSLRMMSKANSPVIELGVNDSPDKHNIYRPSAGLTIRDGENTPVIRLRSVNKGDGSLSFSSTRTEDQVTVGRMPYGDVINDHDYATWGIVVRGADHQSTGVGVYTEDGVAQYFVGPAETHPRN